jgi:iron(III) transport system permease protein
MKLATHKRSIRTFTLYSLLLLIAILCFGPFIVLIVKGFSLDEQAQQVWLFIRAHLLTRFFLNTLFLLVGVGLGASILGSSLAFLITLTSIPYRRLLHFLLILPISLPLYLLSYIYIGAFEYSGALPTFFRDLGLPWSFSAVKHPIFMIFIFTLGLYPYVYLLTRNALLKMGPQMIKSSRSLGLSPWMTLRLIILPFCKPWIAAGTSLAVMEALADFGGVSLFQFETLTTAIYTAWFGLYSLETAARLSCVLIFIALLLYGMENFLSRGTRYSSTGKSWNPSPLFVFQRWQKIVTLCFISLVIFFAVGFPALQLIAWLPTGLKIEPIQLYIVLTSQTFLIGLIASLFTFFLALTLGLIKRHSHGLISAFLLQISLLGYAMPGTLIAVAVYLYMQYFGVTIGSSVMVLTIGLAIRFLVVGFRPLDTGLRSIPPSLTQASNNLGASTLTTYKKIILPLMKPGMIASLSLLFIEVVKEMPITLMLKPFGFSTLSVRLFELTAEGEWERASISGILILIVGLLGPLFLYRLEENHD